MNLRHVVAGGYPRDIHHGRIPKDIDICVLASDYPVEEILTKFKDQILEEEGFDEFYESDRIAYVVKLKNNRDIIAYHAITLDEIVNKFDFNINQYAMLDNKPVFLGEDEGTLVQLRDDLSDERISHIKNKAKELGWKV